MSEMQLLNPPSYLTKLISKPQDKPRPEAEIILGVVGSIPQLGMLPCCRNGTNSDVS